MSLCCCAAAEEGAALRPSPLIKLVTSSTFALAETPLLVASTPVEERAEAEATLTTAIAGFGGVRRAEDDEAAEASGASPAVPVPVRAFVLANCGG